MNFIQTILRIAFKLVLIAIQVSAEVIELLAISVKTLSQSALKK
jgi:hypothetical protein